MQDKDIFAQIAKKPGVMVISIDEKRNRIGLPLKQDPDDAMQKEAKA